MKDFLKKLRKNWITVWLVAAIMLSGVFIAFAAYKKVTSVKRVVTTQSSPDVRFSSNCMLRDVYNKRMPAEQFTITVCNYDQSAKEKFNTNMITYTFTAQLLVRWGDDWITMSDLQGKVGAENGITQDLYEQYVEYAKGYKIKKTQDDAEETPFSDNSEFSFYEYDDYTVTGLSNQSLPGTAPNTDKFLVTIPEGDFSEDKTFQFYVLVEAEPTGDASLPKKISTRLYGSKNVVVTASWEGNLVEQSTATQDYDFYNYVITGSGKGKLDIMWDPKMFTVSDFFFNGTLSGAKFLNGKTEPEQINDSKSDYDGWYKVTIEVNSENEDDVKGQNRYELQLFKTKSDTPYTGENDASKFIACSLQSDAEDTGN